MNHCLARMRKFHGLVSCLFFAACALNVQGLTLEKNVTQAYYDTWLKQTNTTSPSSIFQTFKPTKNGWLHSIELQLLKRDPAAPSLTIKIRQGGPTGSIVYSRSFAQTEGWYAYMLSGQAGVTPAALLAGQLYTIELITPSFVRVSGPAMDRYTNGALSLGRWSNGQLAADPTNYTHNPVMAISPTYTNMDLVFVMTMQLEADPVTQTNHINRLSTMAIGSDLGDGWKLSGRWDGGIRNQTLDTSNGSSIGFSTQ